MKTNKLFGIKTKGVFQKENKKSFWNCFDRKSKRKVEGAR
jgi:hypothetical protein